MIGKTQAHIITRFQEKKQAVLSATFLFGAFGYPHFNSELTQFRYFTTLLNHGAVAQLARALEWHSRGQGFNSP
jgi:hypothetical protein